MDRITAIRKSLTAFVCGIVGLLPVVGLIPAICSLSLCLAVRSKYRGQWNPASAYLRAGTAFALFGLLLTILLVFVIAISVAGDWEL
jgi:hypothetical protein